MEHDISYKAKTRLYLEPSLAENRLIPLKRVQAHFLRHVLRLRDGAAIDVFNGRDGEWRATLSDQELMLHGQIRPQQSLRPLTLLFAPLKKDQTDFVLQKATELGVTHLQPVFTERTNTHRFNSERAQAQIIEAAEQCGRLCVPEIRPPLPLSSALTDWPTDNIILWGDEMGQGQPLSSAIQQLPLANAVLIGPEGGFSTNERTQLLGLSFIRPITLGPRILRAETAAIAALSVFQASIGDWA